MAKPPRMSAPKVKPMQTAPKSKLVQVSPKERLRDPPKLVQVSPKEWRRRESGETVADVKKRMAQETAKAAADRARGERNLQAQRTLDRMVGATPPKNKPATPTMSPAARAATQATLSRAERVQAEEARGDAMLMRRRPAAKDTISVVTRMRETPVKKGK